jgi:hypothetical protein
MEVNDHDSVSEELLAVDGRWVDARLQEIREFVQKRQQDILWAPLRRGELNCRNTARRSRSRRRGRLSELREIGTYSAHVRIGAGGPACTLLPQANFLVELVA